MSGSPVLLLFSLLFIVTGLFLVRKLSRGDDKAAQRPHDDSVIEDYLCALKDFVPDAKISVDVEADTIKLDQGESGTLFLGNMRAQVSELGRADQKEKIREFIRIGVAGEDPDPETIREGLMLRPRTSEEISLRQLATGDKFTPVLRRVGDLFLEMICDLGPVMRSVTPELLESAGLSEDDAFNLAIDNLRSITPTTVDALWEELEPDIWAMRIVDDYSAARMLTFAGDLPYPVETVGTIFMPRHGTVLLIAGDDPDRQHQLFDLGRDLSAVQRKFSMSLYEPGPDGLITVTHGATAILAESIAEFQALEEQTDVLNQMDAMQKDDIFVPKPLLLDGEERAPGIPRIGCVLINGSTLLPQVDTLILVDEGNGNKMYEVAWNDAARILGHDRLTPYPGLFPVRYDLREPLANDVMEALMQAGTLRPKKEKNS